ncbi:MAG: hypothetical protein GWO79_00900, partial [Actinobacteria bacterium]|nr:hypothetical protein [Actinomycetota bacterium]
IINNLKLKYSKFKIQNSKFKRYPFDVEIILLLIISYIAVAVSGFSNDALGIWKAYFFEPALLFILAINVFGNRDTKKSPQPPFNKGWNKILWPLAISALIVSLFAIYQKFTGAFIPNEFWAAEETRRVTSFFGYPNAVGLYLGPIILVLFGWIVSGLNTSQITNYKLQITNKFKITNSKILARILFAGIVIILSVLAIYFAKSEGALIGVAAGLFVFGFLSNRKIRWITAGAAVLAAAGIMAFTPIREYAAEKIMLKDLSGEIRKAQWMETVEMLKDGRLITGAGLANYQEAIKPYHKEGIFFNKDNDPDFIRKIVIFDERYKSKYWQPTEIYLYPHNIFLNFWVELGIAGVLLFTWIIGKYFYIGFKIIRNPKSEIRNPHGLKNKYLTSGLLGAMAVMVIHGMVDVPYFKNDLAVMFWVFIAMMGLINLDLKYENRK